MRNILLLIKNEINCALGFLQGKKNRKKTSVAVLLFVLLFVGFCVLYGMQIYGLFATMNSQELYKIPVYNSYLIALFVIVMLAFQKISTKNTTNDSDLLLSMPIKKFEIVIAKTIGRYAFDLMFVCAFILPTIVLYSWQITLSASFILWNILIIFLLPLFSCGLSYILNFVVSKLFNKIRYGNVLKIIFGLLFFGLFLALYLSTTFSYGNVDIDSVDDFTKRVLPVYWLVELVFSNNLLYLLFIALCTILPFVFGVTLYTLNFGKDLYSYNQSNKKLSYSNKGLFRGLLHKEFARYLSSPIYIFNTIFGPLLLVIFSIFILIKGSDGISQLLQIQLDNNSIIFYCIIIFGFLTATTLISCCSISLEGKNLWILKSTPIKNNQVILAKTLPNVLIMIPFILVCAIIINIKLQANISQWLFLIIIPVLLNLICSFGGVFINILFPKLNWDNEAQVVKQSASVVITMLFGIILAMLPIALQYIPNINMSMIGYLTIVIYSVILIVVISFLFTVGKKKFEQLVD